MIYNAINLVLLSKTKFMSSFAGENWLRDIVFFMVNYSFKGVNHIAGENQLINTMLQIIQNYK